MRPVYEACRQILPIRKSASDAPTRSDRAQTLTEAVKSNVAKAASTLADRRCISILTGYGLFKALMEQSYSTAMSTVENSLLIINSIQFSIASSFFIILCSAILCMVGWKFTCAPLRIPASVSILLLAGGNMLSALGAFSGIPSSWTSILLAGIYGISSIVGNTVWLAAIASLETGACLGALVLGALLGSACSMLLDVLPDGVAIPPLVAIGLASALLLARQTPVEPAPVPPDAQADGAARTPVARARCAFSSIASALVIYVCLNAVAGLLIAFQVSDAQLLNGTSSLKGLATAGAYITLALIALCSRSTLNLKRAFGNLFPVVALLLIVLPFMDEVYGSAFSTLLTFFNGIVSVTTLFLLVDAAKTWRVPVVASVAAITLASRIAVLLGLLGGNTLGSALTMNATVKSLIVVLAAIYLLSLALAALSRSHGAHTQGGRVDADGMHADGNASEENRPDSARVASGDPLEQRGEQIARAYRLTARESEVASLLARGRSTVYIADTLGISPNTVRGYTQDLYAKLDVHSKQELIDLFSEGVG